MFEIKGKYKYCAQGMDQINEFPKMVWFTEDSILNGAVFVRNYNDYLFLLDELAYAVKAIDKAL